MSLVLLSAAAAAQSEPANLEHQNFGFETQVVHRVDQSDAGQLQTEQLEPMFRKINDAYARFPVYAWWRQRSMPQ